jgi:outer membrane protein OmpA-like peptidoglycan-associated protein
MSKPKYLLLATGVFIGLLAFGLKVYRPLIERDLTLRTRQALAEKSIPLKAIRFEGRDGYVRVESASDKEAQAAVRSVHGVRVARVIAESPVLTPPTLQIERVGEIIDLKGTLGSEAQKGWLEGFIQTQFKGFEVRSELRTSSQVETAPYVTAMGPLVSLLQSIGPNASLTLESVFVRLSGQVPTESQKLRTIEEANAAVPRGLSLQLELTAPPVAAPVEERKVAKDAVKEFENTRLHFEFDSSDLAKSSIGLVEPLVEVARDLSGVKVRIIGHADARGSDLYNSKLSLRRALSIQKLFEAQGLTLGFQSEGRGESQPVATNSTDEGRAQNRRVEFQVIEGG